MLICAVCMDEIDADDTPPQDAIAVVCEDCIDRLGEDKCQAIVMGGGQ